MRIDLYTLVPHPESYNVQENIERLLTLDLANRNRQRQVNYIRLEHAKYVRGLWYCDFVKVRMDHGPARAGLNAEVEGFDLARDEGFGEETGFLWDTSNNYCLVQYNHYGVRAAAIAGYLSEFSEVPGGVMFLPRIDEKIHDKIRRKKLVSRFEVTIAPKLLDDGDFDAGMAVGAAAKDLKSTGAERVTIEISSAARAGFLRYPLTSLAKWVERLVGRSEDETPLVSSARATAREEEDEKPEVLDLLSHRITTDVELKAGADKRYSREDRWAALAQAHLAWKKVMANEPQN